MLRDTILLLQLVGTFAGCGCYTEWVRKSWWFVVWYEPRVRCSYDTCWVSPVMGTLGGVAGIAFLSLVAKRIGSKRRIEREALLDEESDDDQEANFKGGVGRPTIQLDSKLRLEYSENASAAQ